MMRSIFHLEKGAQVPFHAEVYFVNLRAVTALKWGTESRISFIEPVTGIPMDIGAYGSLSISVSDPRKLLVKLVGTAHGIDWEGEEDSKPLQETFRPVILSEVKNYLASAIRDLGLSIFELDSHLLELSSELRRRIAPAFDDDGLHLTDFRIISISLPENAPAFRRYREQMGRRYLDVKDEEIGASVAAAEQKRRLIETETEANIAILKARGDAEALKARGMAEAEVMRAKGYTEKDRMNADVQKAFAEGLGNMGPKEVSGGDGGLATGYVSLAAGLKDADVLGSKMSEAFSTSPKEEPKKDTWDCICGAKGLSGNFCPECGRKRG